MIRLSNELIYFATGNDNKYQEAKSIFQVYNIQVEKLLVNRIEIQDEDPEKIARFSLEMISSSPQKVFIEDSGLHINALNGFPSPYSSYVYKTIGNEGILRLLKEMKDRRAVFYSVIAYKDEFKDIHVFRGETEGKISELISKGDGWGFDPIFIPITSDKNTLTYSELGFEKKNLLSHRSRSFQKLCRFLSQ